MTEETRTLVVEREFPHSPEKLWRALTQPHLIAEWLMRNDFAPVVGPQFSLRMDPQPNWSGVIDCRVLVVELRDRYGRSCFDSRRQRGQWPACGRLTHRSR